MSEAQSKLPTYQGENKQRYEGPDTSQYKVYMLKDLGDGEVYSAEAFYLSDIYENEYDVLDDEGQPTGDTTLKYSAGLQIINHSMEWKIKAKINLKNDNDAFEAMQGSALYDLIDSLIDYNEPGSAGAFNVWKGSFKEWQEHINQLKNMNIEVKERSFGKQGSIYNTLRFIRQEDEE